MARRVELTQLDVVIGSHQVPLWPSAIAMLVTGGLSVWLWKLSGDRPYGTDTHGGAAPE